MTIKGRTNHYSSHNQLFRHGKGRVSFLSDRIKIEYRHHPFQMRITANVEGEGIVQKNGEK
ncbi:MAG: hypothetical protein WAN47_00345 [Nitrosotalea sp.]